MKYRLARGGNSSPWVKHFGGVTDIESQCTPRHANINYHLQLHEITEIGWIYSILTETESSLTKTAVPREEEEKRTYQAGRQITIVKLDVKLFKQ